MVSRAKDAIPNVVLYNLRDAAGQTQQDLAEALNKLGAQRGRRIGVTANQVSRWERGITHPTALFRQLLAEHYDVSLEELGLTRPKTAPPKPRAGPDEGEVFAIYEGDPHATAGGRVQTSQDEWRAVRRNLNAYRVPLAREANLLYDPAHRLGDTGLIAPPAWLPAQPIELTDVGIALAADAPAPTVLGTEDAAAHTRPYMAEDRRYQRYSHALRGIEQPRLLENRVCWRLLDVDWTRPGEVLRFGTGTYFGMLDTAEALAHEMAAHHVTADAILPAAWRGLTLRRSLDDPFDLGRRMLVPSIDTLTLRVDDDGVTFVLHNRYAGNVAVAGGMLHIMPAGVFQPSSILPAAQETDFDLWHNVVREYSEEFLGNAEHGGDGEPADYTTEPLAPLMAARDTGTVRVYCLGVALDALTLWGEILTVAVFDGPTYDRLFAGMVDANDEGTIVKTGRARPTSALPFTRHVIDELAESGRLAPAAAGCIHLAWEHRAAILGRK